MSWAAGPDTRTGHLPPVTSAAYRAHANASELLAKGAMTADAKQALQADLLRPEQIAALEQMKKHTDFNDVAQQSALGREALLRQVLPQVKQAQLIHQAADQKQAQEHAQRQTQGVRQRQGHRLRAGCGLDGADVAAIDLANPGAGPAYHWPAAPMKKGPAPLKGKSDPAKRNAPGLPIPRRPP